MSVRYAGFGLRGPGAARLGQAQGEPRDIPNAVAAPFGSVSWDLSSPQAGIYTAQGRAVRESLLWRDGRQLTTGAQCPDAAHAKLVRGKTFYIGIVSPHFGHFLTETLNRLSWLTPEALRKFDHFAAIPATPKLKPFARHALELFGIADKVRLVREPTRFESMTVCPPVIGLHDFVDGRVRGLSALLGEAGGHVNKRGTLFLSRSRVGMEGYGRAVLGERAIKAVLKRNGATVVKPETLPLAEQVRLFREHATIVGFAGSGLHSLLLSGGGKRMVGYTARKLLPIFPLIDTALGNDAVYVNAAHPKVPGLTRERVGFSPELLDAEPVLAELEREGIIDGYDARDLDTPEQKAKLAGRYNSCVLLRLLAESEGRLPEAVCHERVRSFVRDNVVHKVALKKAAKKHARFRPYLMDLSLTRTP